MRFVLTVDMDNAAFEDNPDELAEILAGLAEGMTGVVNVSHGAAGPVRDSNGNSVGSWKVQPSK